MELGFDMLREVTKEWGGPGVQRALKILKLPYLSVSVGLTLLLFAHGAKRAKDRFRLTWVE